MQHKTV